MPEHFEITALKGLKINISVRNRINQFYQFQLAKRSEEPLAGASFRSKELKTGSRS